MPEFSSLSVILLAAGLSQRFAGNKLLTAINNAPMYTYAVETALKLPAERIILVTAYEEMIRGISQTSIHAVLNDRKEAGIAYSIRLGLNALNDVGFSDACLFMVCDQPWLRADTVLTLIRQWEISGKGMACLSHHGSHGNPVIFHRRYFPELLSLAGDIGGKSVLKKHPEDLLMVEVTDPLELRDIDTAGDLCPDLRLH